jgi:ferredoxin-NADP reductase
VSPRLIMKLSVAGIRRDRGDVMVLTLKHERRPLLPAFTAGSHVDVHLPDGRIRQYSLCNDPADRTHYQLAIKREHGGRGGSIWLHENLVEGATLQVSAPRNHFELSDHAERHLLLAGGIGITPILSMSRALAAANRPFEVYYFTRSRAVTPLLADVASVQQAARMCHHFDDEPDTRADIAGLLAGPTEGTHLYYCGPPGFMDVVRANAAHWPQDAVHFEAFQAVLDETFVPEPFTISLRSGRTLEVPADRSALEALRLAGVDVQSSCETGICGTCECAYSDGEPIHRDSVLSADARCTRFMPCVSRAKGVLTLDL